MDTALHVAVRENKSECIKLLLDAGADTAIVSVRGPVFDPSRPIASA